jgi:hypothetical protein
MNTRVLFACLAIAVQSSVAFAADLLVPSQYSSIQSAINAAVDGDRVVLAPGTYNEQMTIDNKSITITSSGGPAVTKIDRVGNSGTIFYVPGGADKAVTFEGLTITRWYVYSYMVHSEAPSIVMKNVRCFQGGVGLYLRNGADATLEDCSWILMGSWDNGDNWNAIRGFEAGTNITIRRSSFQGLRAYYGSVARTTSQGSVDVEDSSFTNCYSRYRGGCIFADGDARVSMSRVTISDCRNTDAETGGVVWTSSGAVTVSDCSATNIYSVRVGAFVFSESGAVTVRRTSVLDSYSNSDGGYDEAGGYIHVGDAALLVEDCTFKNLYTNGCSVWGAVIGSRTGNAPITVTGTRFENCAARNYCASRTGRVIHSYYRPLTVTNCTFVGSNPWQGWDGGGSRYGGAIAVEGGTYSISGCTFTDQRATERGGAIYAYGPASGAIAGCTFTRCLNASNAIGFDQGADGQTWSVSDCVFSGCGIYNFNSRPMLVQRCVFNRDPSFADARIESYNSAPEFDRCAFKNSGGSSSIVVGGSNYVLLSTCGFCRSATQEISGYYFVNQQCVFDADCARDCDADGTPDQFEVKAGVDTDCNSNGTPDSCETSSGSDPDCDDNGLRDICEIFSGSAPDCNQNGILDSCEADCDQDGIPNSCEIASGASDCDQNGVPDSCQADCDSDGLIDRCAITAGAVDCNQNSVPDSCEIATTPTLDLNTDAVLDSCQPDMQFAGLQLEIVPIARRGTDDLFPAGAVCYRLYARVSDSAASVVGVYGNFQYPMVLNANGGFWQSQYGAGFSNLIPCENPGARSSYKYDSWFGVGLDCIDGNATQQMGIDLTSFNTGGGVNDNDGIVFVTPGSPQGFGGDSKRVLLAQLTTTEPVFPTGRVNVVGRSSLGIGEVHAWRAFGQQIPMPALVDCNGNGEHDAFDIARGTARDCDQSGIPDECEHPSAVTDCNSNGISDLCDCYSGFSSDLNTNQVPDECECTGDVDANGRVDVDDIVWVLISWGDGPNSRADLNSDGIVNGVDLSLVLGGWGNCL